MTLAEIIENWISDNKNFKDERISIYRSEISIGIFNYWVGTIYDDHIKYWLYTNIESTDGKWATLYASDPKFFDKLESYIINDCKACITWQCRTVTSNQS